MVKGSFRISMTLQEVNDDSYFELENITRTKIIMFDNESDYNRFLRTVSDSFHKYINEVLK